jgi:hypothetical protein
MCVFPFVELLYGNSYIFSKVNIFQKKSTSWF